MACKHLGWLINHFYYWCYKDENKNPFEDCKNCPYREEQDIYITTTTNSASTLVIEPYNDDEVNIIKKIH